MEVRHPCNLRLTHVPTSTGVLPGAAQTVRALDCPLGDVTRLSAGGGALPVIMSIIGPRETHDYRNYNLLGSGINTSKKTKKKKRKKNTTRTVALLAPPSSSCLLYGFCSFPRRNGPLERATGYSRWPSRLMLS